MRPIQTLSSFMSSLHRRVPRPQKPHSKSHESHPFISTKCRSIDQTLHHIRTFNLSLLQLSSTSQPSTLGLFIPTNPTSAMAQFTVTPEEFRSFHSIDCEVFSRLVINLGRDIDQSKQIIGFWLWMEEVGYPSIINKMFSLPDIVVNALADEAASGLICISNNDAPPPSPYGAMPLTLVLAEQDISHQLIYENRVSATNGVGKFVRTVCDRAFDDIVEQVHANAAQPTVVPHGEGSSGTVYDPRGKQMMMVPGTTLFRPVVYPGLQLPFFGPRVGVHQQMLPRGPGFPLGSSSTVRVQPENPTEEEVPQDERTMFMTFSKGYTVSEGELLDYLTITYGDCIEAIYMQEVPNNEQPLYARVVFRSLSTINLILNETELRKFGINGKNVWARKFVPKRSKQPPPPPPPAAAPGF